MFEKALIRRIGLERYVDIGAIAETLLFYGASHFHFDRGSLVALAQTVGVDTLVELLEREGVSASFAQQNYVVVTHNTGGIKSHEFSAMSLAAAKGRRLRFDDEIEQLIKRATGSDLRARTRRTLVENIKPFRMEYTGANLHDLPVATGVDILDEKFLSAAARVVITQLVPTLRLATDFYFKAHETDGGFFVETNLSFTTANNEYHKYVPPEHSSLSEAYVLSHILDANFDAFLAANYMAEIVTGPIYSDLIKLKNGLLLRRRNISVDDIASFQEIVFGQAKALREALQTGERSFSDFLRLLDEAQKYKTWIAGQNPDISLVRAYYDEIARKSWLDRLPSKAARFVMATGAGVAADLLTGGTLATVAGISAGAVDTFFVDRMIRGWRPSQFVQGPLKDFVRR